MCTPRQILMAHRRACRRYFEIVELNRMAGADNWQTVDAARKETDKQFLVELEKLLDGEPCDS